jgi:cell wall assembly regulator SMI1
MELYWKEIKEILSSLGCIDKLPLNQGATASELGELEIYIGVALPTELKNFLSVHNGQKNEGPGLVFGQRLLSTNGIRQCWDDWRNLDETKMNEDCDGLMKSDPEGYIKPMYTNKNWIPISYDWGGNHIGIDYDPDEKGRVGQIIAFGRDADTKRLIVSDFSNFISILLVFLKNAQWTGEYLEGKSISEVQSLYISNTIDAVGSTDNAQALSALDALRVDDRLTGEGGVLQNQSFPQADWEKANLREAYLYETQLNGAILRRADLHKATLSFVRLENGDLRGATLSSTSLDHARLQSADLRGANLRSAWCYNTNLGEADLREAILSSTHLEEVNLEGAQLDQAHFDRQTVLPDAKYLLDEKGEPIISGPVEERYTEESFWSVKTDMSRYTNSQHPAFWQPCWALLGMASFWEWLIARKPTPWIKAGFGELEHMEWAHAGKP